jgi:hypothetical protein
MPEFRAVPKPPGREFQALERAAQPERDAAQVRVRLAAEAVEAKRALKVKGALAVGSAGSAGSAASPASAASARVTARPSGLIERILRIGRRRR